MEDQDFGDQQDDGRCSEAEASDAVSLPDSINSGHVSGQKVSKTCCSNQCDKKFHGAVEAYKLTLQQVSMRETQEHKFAKLKAVFDANDNARQGKGGPPLQWSWQEGPCCRKFFEQVNGLSPGKVDDWLKLLRAGQVVLPAAKKPRLSKPEPMIERINVWFLDVYQFLADPLAIPGSEDRFVSEQQSDSQAEAAQRPAEAVQQHEIVDDVSHPLHGLSFALQEASDKGPKIVAGRRHVNFATLLDLFLGGEQKT